MKIYFYSTDNKNLKIGPRLQSDDEIAISFVNQGENLKSCQSASERNPIEEPVIYVVLKNGILIPRPVEKKCDDDDNSNKYVEHNKCVYQSLKPTYYVKSFKNILIPADVLYSKVKQGEIFDGKRLEKITSSGSDSRKKERVFDEVNLKKESNFSILKSDPEIIVDLQKSIKKSTQFESLLDSHKKLNSDFLVNEVEEEDLAPDKTCRGEVTLFVLKNDGIFRRITADPYMPIGLHLSYSLLNNFVLQPRFLKGSDLVVSYVTGENGDLIPHSKNSHRISAEVGESVSFMLSKSGALFPVKEEKKLNKLISYYFNGHLIHESQQFTKTYSNSTSLLINNKTSRLFNDDDNTKKANSVKFNEVSESSEKESKKIRHHHVRKREAYFDGYERSGNSHTQSAIEPHSIIEPLTFASHQNRLDDNSSRDLKSQAFYRARQISSMPDAPVSNNLQPDFRYSENAKDISQDPSKIAPPNFGTIPKTGFNSRSEFFSESSDAFEQAREDAPLDVPSSDWNNSSVIPRADIFIFNEKGSRMRLVPQLTDANDVVIYKLTCKGNLVRYPPCKEPEFGFEINFELLMDEFVLVPTISTKNKYHMAYVLQENGDLTPSENNVNTFKKAPGSLIYYMLGKNNILFPVHQLIDMEGNVSFFYQDVFILKMKDSVDKPLHFTTKGSPLFAFFNGLTVISMSSKPNLNSLSGSNWTTYKPSQKSESFPKAMYLTGPEGEMIKIVPYKNKAGVTVVYELDCNGILYRSPKENKKCIILRSYILLKEGILLPTNNTTGYVYMVSKNGDLFPYLYPDGKIEAPLASSLKYVLCEKGILLPIKLEIINNSICYIFQDVVVYKERVYCKMSLENLSDQKLDQFKTKFKKSSCDFYTNETNNAEEEDVIKLHVDKKGNYVFYEKQNKILKRCPPESVPTYLKYTMGSFEVKSDGSLYQIRYQDPNKNVVNLMLEPNGDLLEDTRNVNNLRSEYYVLDAKGNLISVEVRKTKKNLHFYKGSTRLCKVPIPNYEKAAEIDALDVEEIKTPLGKDPLKLMDDPFPARNNGNGGDTRSLYIPIPLTSLTVSNPEDAFVDAYRDSEHKKKCHILKDTIEQLSKGSSLPLALELELTDEIVEELKNWASKCDKILNKRGVQNEFGSF